MIAPNDDMETFVAKVVSLMEDETLRERLAGCGLESVKRFMVEKIVGEWEKLLSSLNSGDSMQELQQRRVLK
jgi:hypothetical protein